MCDTVKSVMGAWRYDDEDMERLSVIATIRDIGFEYGEIANYLRRQMRKPTEKKFLT